MKRTCDHSESVIRVVIESPFAGDVARNLTYLRAAMHDCLHRGEAPYASHGLYTQPGVLDDLKPEERQRGIAAGHAWYDVAQYIVAYTDYDISLGMKIGMAHALTLGKEIRYRELYQTHLCVCQHPFSAHRHTQMDDKCTIGTTDSSTAFQTKLCECMHYVPQVGIQ